MLATLGNQTHSRLFDTRRDLHRRVRRFSWTEAADRVRDRAWTWAGRAGWLVGAAYALAVVGWVLHRYAT